METAVTKKIEFSEIKNSIVPLNINFVLEYKV